jgi:hypothetical protein
MLTGDWRMPWPQVGTRCRPNGWVRSAMPGRGPRHRRRLRRGWSRERGHADRGCGGACQLQKLATCQLSHGAPLCGSEQATTVAKPRLRLGVGRLCLTSVRLATGTRGGAAAGPRHMAASSLQPRSGRSTCPPVDRLTCGVVDPWLSVVDSWSLMVRRPGAARILVPALAPPEGEGEPGTPATACRCKAGPAGGLRPPSGPALKMLRNF